MKQEPTMTSDSRFQELAERVEGLSGPSREVDGDIFQTLGGAAWNKACQRASEPCGCPEDTMIRIARERFAPDYTAFLDIVVKLIEDRLPVSWRVGNLPSRRAFAQVGTKPIEVIAATPALALLAAATANAPPAS
jgi:hypothetical protein